MSITSLVFLLFVFATLIVYYIVPKKAQWIILLISSLIFYVTSCYWGIFYVLTTSLTVYIATITIDKLKKQQKHMLKTNKLQWSKDEKKQYKEKIKSKNKKILIFTLFLNFGILCIIKYSAFAVEQFNSIANFFSASGFSGTLNLPMVLGISFYTFQSMGYLVEVYWGNVEAEHNYFKTLLFVSFFPQITQGPISNYSQLSSQLFDKHLFSYYNYSHGAQRMLWGFFKKMVIADYLAPCVTDLFNNYNQYSSISCFIGIFMYSIQIYADFSGYMDIMCGICKMLGITLAENFERPYFSKSIAEYWRRWHITLGTWFKNYIYYPIGISKWNRNLGKHCQKRFGKHVGSTLPASVALVIVWLTTGLWHGASWAYISWGLINGLFIIFSLWMNPVYESIKQKLKINETSFTWRCFQVIRTFILVTFIKVLPEVGTLSEGLGLWKRILFDFSSLDSLSNLMPFISDKFTFVFVILGIVLMFIVSLIQRKASISKTIDKTPSPFVVIGFTILIIQILVFGVANSGNGGFLYAQF